jgi:hypothetical protein
MALACAICLAVIAEAKTSRLDVTVSPSSPVNDEDARLNHI